MLATWLMKDEEAPSKGMLTAKSPPGLTGSMAAARALRAGAATNPATHSATATPIAATIRARPRDLILAQPFVRV